MLRFKILLAPKKQFRTQGPDLEMPALHPSPILGSGNTLRICTKPAIIGRMRCTHATRSLSLWSPARRPVAHMTLECFEVAEQVPVFDCCLDWCGQNVPSGYRSCSQSVSGYGELKGWKEGTVPQCADPCIIYKPVSHEANSVRSNTAGLCGAGLRAKKWPKFCSLIRTQSINRATRVK